MSQGRLIVELAGARRLGLLSSCGEQVVVRETQATCGNGSIEVEACDDGNEANDDGCTNKYAMAICGDAVQRTDLEPGDDGFETCDDGNDVDTDGCTNACLVAPAATASCARTSTRARSGSSSAMMVTSRAQTCLSDCQVARCGDGVLRTDRTPNDPDYEACDDGNDDDSDTCLSEAALRRCGDGVVGPGEGAMTATIPDRCLQQLSAVDLWRWCHSRG